ncbi:MAG: tRNA (guanosine(46)-N7)-methyltransferase TrmB [Actinomycetaceae bacterium]|nr:tRNA (guanosine(46)-N7)-methyltransferase TrmB [Actinomycetaceae bacterium]
MEKFLARTKSFVRRGREVEGPLGRTFAKYGADYVVSVRRGLGYTTVAEDHDLLDFAGLFENEAPVTVEVGSGTGDQLVAAAARHPDRNFLAFEVWVPGLAKTVSKAHSLGLTNLRLIEADVQQASCIIIPQGAVAEVWTFFPDPWRKSKHKKRRLIQEPFALEVARMLEKGGIWRIATDWDDYAWGIRDVLDRAAPLKNLYRGLNPDARDPEGDRGGFAPRWEGRVMTAFEQKGLDAGRVVHDFAAQKL